MGDAEDQKPLIKKEAEQSKPGQKYPTPSPGVAERIFYETLYHQNPDSFMAQEYCVLYGILSATEAAKVWKIVQKRKLEAKGGVIAPSPPRKKEKTSKRKALVDDDADDADTGLRDGVYEGVGTTEM